MLAYEYDADFILAATDTLAYGERVATEEMELSAETRAMLETLCAEVDEITSDMEVDFSDSLADLDEILDRHGI